MTEGVYSQPGSGARFDWGPAGAAELARVCSVLVVVDVLSFSTAVDIAVGRGMRVHPFPWSDQAQAYADRAGYGAMALGMEPAGHGRGVAQAGGDDRHACRCGSGADRRAVR